MLRKYMTPVLLSLFFICGCATTPATVTPDTAEAKAEKSPASKKFMEGLMLMNHGNWDKAEKALTEAIELNPQSYDSHIYLAKVYENKGNKMKAIEEYRKAITLKKEKTAAYYGLTGIYIDMGLPAEAAKLGEEALKNGAPAAVVSTDLGWSYYLAGDMKKAEARLRVAKELVKEDTAPRHDLGLALFTLGKYEEALDNFKEVLKMNPKSVLMPYYIALTYNKMGKETEALDALREAVAKDADLPKKAAFYNKQYFPYTDPGDLGPYFEKLKKEKPAK